MDNQIFFNDEIFKINQSLDKIASITSKESEEYLQIQLIRDNIRDLKKLKSGKYIW